MFEPYLVNTWIAGSAVAVSAGIIGVFVMLRGDAFLAHAIPHGSFAGASAAVLIGANPVLGMGVAAVASAALMHLFARRGRRDAVIALILVFLLATGSFLLALSGNYANEAYALLFGQILAVSDGDLRVMTLLAIVAVLAVFVMARPLLAASVMPRQASAQGVRNGAVGLGFTLVIACITTASVPIVGAMLLFSMLVAPAAAACSLCRTPVHAMAVSAVLAVLCMWTSIAVSVTWDLPVGFPVSMTTLVVFVGARAIARVRDRDGETA